MAELITYREAVARALAQEMERDDTVYFIGEDVAAAGGVFKTTSGLLERFGPKRVRDTPISEEAIIGAVMGAAMNGLRPVAEIMFSDFLATCWDLVANQIAKTRYMTDGQVTLPLVIRTANGGGVRFGAQHSQSVENWAMAVPGLKVVAPSTPRDVVELMAASIRDPDPVVFFEHKALFANRGPIPDGELVGELGKASVVRQGSAVLDQDAVAQFQALRQIMGHEQHGMVPILETSENPRQEPVALLVQTHVGFIQQEQAGLVQEGPAQREPLFHAPRILPDQLLPGS